ncbi:hypothetical protein WJX74_011111 [Apatococcus lobatus]|uniref:Uncharacterized protein n=1 Tax=Apatococcus lobatus TaxID=904363 RepID=A0AAW1SCU0_9CHLO
MGLVPSYPNANPHVPATCGYNRTLNGAACCDAAGNPCHPLEEHPDCCQSGDYKDSCYAKFNADGVDPSNYMVTDSYGNTEAKQCIYDGGDPSGRGRCYAPTLEKPIWQCELQQTVALSKTFQTANPLIMDTANLDQCLGGYGILQTSQYQKLKVYPSCNAGGAQDGDACASNQKAGKCNAGQCIQSSS